MEFYDSKGPQSVQIAPTKPLNHELEDFKKELVLIDDVEMADTGFF